MLVKISRDFVEAMREAPGAVAFTLEADPARPVFVARLVASIQCVYAIEELTG